jgi:hypothetical protein
MILAYTSQNSSTGLTFLQMTNLPAAIKNVSPIGGTIIYLPLSQRLLNSVNGNTIEEALNNVLVEQFNTIRSIKFPDSNKKINNEMTGCYTENMKIKSNHAIGSFNTMASGSIICFIKKSH